MLKEKEKQMKDIMEFQRRRSTNADFFNWYVGRMSNLYKQAFDVSLRFCRMAESIYEDDSGLETTFIKPIFDKKYRGLVSGQVLMINLQNMEYAFLESRVSERDNTSEAQR